MTNGTVNFCASCGVSQFVYFGNQLEFTVRSLILHHPHHMLSRPKKSHLCCSPDLSVMIFVQRSLPLVIQNPPVIPSEEVWKEIHHFLFFDCGQEHLMHSWFLVSLPPKKISSLSYFRDLFWWGFPTLTFPPPPPPPIKNCHSIL